MIPFYLMLQNSEDHLKNEQSICPFKMLTGMPCPSCGITKSIVSFYEGDVPKSLHYHVLGPATVLFSISIIVLLLIEIKTKKEYFNKYLYSRKIAYGLALFLAIYHIIRLVDFLQNHTFQEVLKESVWK
jgi:hypothetical protein